MICERIQIMTKQDCYEGIEHVVHISTNIGSCCEHCSERVGADRFAESVNHYIEKHGYRLLHMGSECDTASNGKPCHHTVAVLGK